MAEFNIYCDESCHLLNDGQQSMTLGAIWTERSEVKEASSRIRDIKIQHGFPSDFEIKWTKVSPSKVDFYLAIVDYFFDDDDLHFRTLVVPDKSKLEHTRFGQNHDDFYYKMYFLLLERLIIPKENYYIYLDIKDTVGTEKVEKLHDVLSNNMYDFDRTIIKRIQLVRSHEVALLQMADLLIGAISHMARGIEGSVAKQAIIQRIRERSKYSLRKSTLPGERKFNLFIWEAR